MQTKYPILLVHGIAVRDGRIFKTFGRIGKILRNEGYVVYTAKIDAFGSVENNAAQLKTQIEEILLANHTEKVNLIAHSKGGLDARYMMDELGMTGAVASLTTLCTPHRGSRMASAIYSRPRWFTKFLAFNLNFWYRIFGDKHPDALTVCRQLQLKTDDEIGDIPVPVGVYCQSYSCTMKRGRDDILMSAPLRFARRWGEEHTDGVVTAESAKFAEYRGDCIDDSVSHTEIMGLCSKKKKKQKIYAFYLSLCFELAQRGF